MAMMARHSLAISLGLSYLAASYAAPASSVVINNEQLFDKPPLRVFVLVGQSNMVGHGTISDIDKSTGQQKNATLEWLVAHAPDQYGKLKQQGGYGVLDDLRVGSIGRVSGSKSQKQKNKKHRHESTWAVRPDVLIACNSRDFNDLKPTITEYGNLYAGLCAGEPSGSKNPPQLGPELGFGWAVGDAYNTVADDDNKILLLKVSWGGKSLAVDFRPPSSGGATGPNYKSMIADVKNTLSEIHHIFPEESGRPVKLSGFAWHQGWNDGCNDTMSAEYEYNLVNFIRDVRKDLNVPDLPFAIAATGMMGYNKKSPSHGPDDRQEIIDAELKVAKYPEFKGNVASIDTRPFAREPPPASPSTQIYHWYRNAETYWLIGNSLGEAMLELIHQREQAPFAEYS